MKRVLTAVVLIILVLVVVFRAPAWLFGLCCSVVALLATHEFLALVEAHGITVLRKTTYSAIIALFGLVMAGAVYLEPDQSFILLPFGSSLAVFAIVPLVLVLSMKGLDVRQALPSAAACVAGIAYIFLPFVCLMDLRLMGPPHSWFFLVLLFLCVWSGDIAAFYVGRGIGRHKLAPTISPNKTWEGTAASLLVSLAIAWCWVKVAPPLSVWLQHIGFTTNVMERHQADFTFPALPLVSVALVTNVAAQLGDLVESMFKRGAGVKDSGTLIPGHGGVLDRIDALLFAAPVVWYYAFFLAIQGA